MTRDLYLQCPLSASKKCIRLLIIQDFTNTGDNGEPLRCSLRAFDLSQNDAFSALSYVWGTKSQPAKTIQIHESLFEVTDNCYEALKQIRRNTGLCSIWVDAICIDQENETEKGQQIALMGQIYSRADGVLIWLGAGTAATERAMVALKTRGYLESAVIEAGDNNTLPGHKAIFTACWRGYSQRWKQWPSVCLLRHRKATSVRGSDSQDDTSIAGFTKLHDDLYELLTREWINRIWTYQEIMLATNPIIMCGASKIAWSDMTIKIIKFDWIIRGYQISSPRDLAPVLETWKKLVLSRNQLQTRDRHRAESTAPGSKDRRGTPYFDDYRKYWTKVAQVWSLMRFLRYVAFAISIAAIAAVLGLYIDGQIQYHRFIHRYHVSLGPDEHQATNAQIEEVCLVQCRSQHRDLCEAQCNIDDLDYGWLLPLVYCGAGVLLFLMFSFYIGRSNRFPTVDVWQSSVQTEADQVNDMIDALCTRRALIPKDKAFGMHSILGELLEEEPLPTDYTLTLEQIYTRFTSTMLQATNSSQLLLAAAVNQLTQSPSWVADWSGNFPRYWMRPQMEYQRGTNATLGSPFEWRYDSDDPATVVVRGRTICTVHAVHSLKLTSDMYQDSENDLHLHNLHTMLQPFDARIPFHRIRLFHPELRDLICNRNNHPALPTEVNQLHLDAYYAFLRSNFARSHSDLLTRLRSSTGSFRFRRDPTFAGAFKLRSSCPYTDIFKAHIAICKSLHRTNRKFLFTNDEVKICTDPSHVLSPHTCQRRMTLVGGSNILLTTSRQPKAWGICTNNVQVGDQVVLIAGLAVPLVVRRGTNTNTCKLVSPAPMFGIMEGQAWPCHILGNDDQRLQDLAIS